MRLVGPLLCYLGLHSWFNVGYRRAPVGLPAKGGSFSRWRVVQVRVCRRCKRRESVACV